ncbi:MULTISPECIES: hypothetical protein [unclassified Streptomyces]|uniref:hypothetical protein n=1 Tax=unclassified Streptomyces TaxID=2593676 RepID=UPI0024410D81|nr:hypothetical protein [Streptomyces sp. DH41]MDG9723728.1 hypothetical protein [Streptomyces sp. DH41]
MDALTQAPPSGAGPREPGHHARPARYGTAPLPAFGQDPGASGAARPGRLRAPAFAGVS